MLVVELALASQLVVEPVLVGLLLAVHRVQLLQVARGLPGRFHLQLLVLVDLRARHDDKTWKQFYVLEID